MRINTNINAMVATNQMAKNTALSGTSMEKLSTGLRITKAGDDATGLAISEKMRAQIRGMEQADRNVQDGISMVQTAEGAMEEIGNITQRMRELAVQASNETNTANDREKLTAELKQLHEEIDRISDSTTFNNSSILKGNGEKLFNSASISAAMTNLKTASYDNGAKVQFSVASVTGASANTHVDITLTIVDANGDEIKSQKLENIKDATAASGTDLNFDELGISFNIATGNSLKTQLNTKAADLNNTSKEVSIQAGANNEVHNKLTVSISAMSTESLGISESDINKIANSDTKLGTEASNKLINRLDDALNRVNSARSTLGAQQNRLEYTSSNLTSSTENLSAAESRIRDVDVAKEMVKLSKLNILNQASQAMVSQAKQQPESVSQLLR